MSTITETLQRDFEFLRSRLDEEAEITLVVSRFSWKPELHYSFIVNKRWTSSNTYDEAFSLALNGLERAITRPKVFATFGLTSDGRFAPETSA